MRLLAPRVSSPTPRGRRQAAGHRAAQKKRAHREQQGEGLADVFGGEGGCCALAHQAPLLGVVGGEEAAVAALAEQLQAGVASRQPGGQAGRRAGGQPGARVVEACVAGPAALPRPACCLQLSEVPAVRPHRSAGLQHSPHQQQPPPTHPPTHPPARPPAHPPTSSTLSYISPALGRSAPRLTTACTSRGSHSTTTLRCSRRSLYMPPPPYCWHHFWKQRCTAWTLTCGQGGEQGGNRGR